jgi:hypothetical protein
MQLIRFFLATLAVVHLLGAPCLADYFYFSTGGPDYRMAAASRPESTYQIEIEAADDFILTSETLVFNATVIGLLPPAAPLSDVERVKVEIYRVFPNDSDTTRTIHVPTRMNSPADVEFDDRDSANGDLSYTVYLLDPYSGADNSVINGIHPLPYQTTGGEGPVVGQEVLIDVTFTIPFDLPADHYFFIPQVSLRNDETFLWLSAPHPQFTGDLQMWIRNADLDPDWLRVGTDIVGGTTPPTFNGTFSLEGLTIGHD